MVGRPTVISLIKQHLLNIGSRQRHAGAVADGMDERMPGEAGVEHIVAGDARQQARRFAPENTESTERITIPARRRYSATTSGLIISMARSLPPRTSLYGGMAPQIVRSAMDVPRRSALALRMTRAKKWDEIWRACGMLNRTSRVSSVSFC